MSRESVPFFFQLCYYIFDETLHDGAIDTLLYLLSLLYKSACVYEVTFTHVKKPHERDRKTCSTFTRFNHVFQFECEF